MTTIVLKHVGGERRVFEIEYVAPTGSYIVIRWPLAGLYHLKLDTNKLVAFSAAARRKGECHWAAEDIASVRKLAQEWLNEKRGITKAREESSMQKHRASMPGKCMATMTYPDNTEVRCSRYKHDDRLHSFPPAPSRAANR